MSHQLLFRLVTLMCIAGGALALTRGDTYAATSLTIAGVIAFAGAHADQPRETMYQHPCRAASGGST